MEQIACDPVYKYFALAAVLYVILTYGMQVNYTQDQMVNVIVAGMVLMLVLDNLTSRDNKVVLGPLKPLANMAGMEGYQNYGPYGAPVNFNAMEEEAVRQANIAAMMQEEQEEATRLEGFPGHNGMSSQQIHRVAQQANRAVHQANIVAMMEEEEEGPMPMGGVEGFGPVGAEEEESEILIDDEGLLPEEDVVMVNTGMPTPEEAMLAPEAPMDVYNNYYHRNMDAGININHTEGLNFRHNQVLGTFPRGLSTHGRPGYYLFNNGKFSNKGVSPDEIASVIQKSKCHDMHHQIAFVPPQSHILHHFGKDRAPLQSERLPQFTGHNGSPLNG